MKKQKPDSHKLKVKLARRLRTYKEMINRVSIFNSEAWNKRKEAIEKRVARKINKTK